MFLLVKVTGSTKRSGECFSKRFSFFLAHYRGSGGRGQQIRLGRVLNHTNNKFGNICINRNYPPFQTDHGDFIHLITTKFLVN